MPLPLPHPTPPHPIPQAQEAAQPLHTSASSQGAGSVLGSKVTPQSITLGSCHAHQSDHMTPIRAGWRPQSEEVTPQAKLVHGVGFICPKWWARRLRRTGQACLCLGIEAQKEEKNCCVAPPSAGAASLTLPPTPGFPSPTVLPGATSVAQYSPWVSSFAFLSLPQWRGGGSMMKRVAPPPLFTFYSLRDNLVRAAYEGRRQGIKTSLKK